MRELTIKRIELLNFKGEKDLKLTFNEGTTNIEGKNGRGKSRVMDAFCWCLWGKDSKDRKDYEIQTRGENGEVVHHLTTEIKVHLNVTEHENDMCNMREIVFSRKMEENWVKPRGCTEARLKGRETKCNIDDIPMSIGEYTKRVNEILDDTTFKLLSNPLYFSTVMEWRKRRELLFQTVQMLTDEEIAQGIEDLQALLARMNGYDFVDYRKMIVSRRNKAKAELDDITPRIDQTEKMKPELRNWSQLEVELKEKELEIADVQKQIGDAKAVVEKILAEKNEMIWKVGLMKSKQVDIVNAENAKRRSEIAEPYNKIAELNKQRNDINSDLAATNKCIIDLQQAIQSNQTKADGVESQIIRLRSKFDVAKSKSLNDYVCSECGQVLPADKAGEQRKNYLLSLKEQASGLKELKEQYSKIVEDSKIQLSLKSVHFQALSSAKNKLAKDIEELESSKPEMKVATIYDIEECMTIQKEIDEIEKAITDIRTEDNADLNERLASITRERDDIKQKLGDRAMIERCDKEIESLKEKAKELAQLIANYQRDEDAMDAFTRRKIEYCEARINSKFDNVSFRLYNVTLEGNLEECCEPMVKGALFGSANTAGQINAGLEIIDVLSEHYGVMVPVWIDNAESVNNVRETRGQQILLRVSEDEQLVVY